MNKNQDPSFYTSLARYGGLGFQLALSVVFGIFGGRALDHRLDSEPVFTLMGVILGTAVGFVGLFRTLLIESDSITPSTPSEKDDKPPNTP